jgi:hypothetical protein
MIKKIFVTKNNWSQWCESQFSLNQVNDFKDLQKAHMSQVRIEEGRKRAIETLKIDLHCTACGRTMVDNLILLKDIDYANGILAQVCEICWNEDFKND